MATRLRTRTGITLEEFLRWTRIDEKPYLEFMDGRIEVKVSPKAKHGLIEATMAEVLNRFARPSKLGLAFSNLRCTFAGRSIVPDVAFLLDRNIRCDEHGEILDEILIPADIHVEIRSPGQGVKKTREKLAHALANGCPLGWYIDPSGRTVEEYRPGQPPRKLSAADVLDGAPVLPGFLLPISEVFGWLAYRVRRPDEPGAEVR